MENGREKVEGEGQERTEGRDRGDRHSNRGGDVIER